VFGQFDGYESEDGVAAGSSTETFVAVRAEIDNDRSRGVALLLRTGEAMAEAGASHRPAGARAPDLRARL
jgi:glucose-6-phosphate 1-dehydrogenase